MKLSKSYQNEVLSFTGKNWKMPHGCGEKAASTLRGTGSLACPAPEFTSLTRQDTQRILQLTRKISALSFTLIKGKQNIFTFFPNEVFFQNHFSQNV